MANIRSSEKDIRRSETRRVRNLEVRSAVRTYIRRFREAVATGDVAKKQDSYKTAQAAIDRAVNKGVMKAATASRYKSRLAAYL